MTQQTYKTAPRSNQQAGFTLIELLVGVAIGLVFILVGLSIYNMVSSGGKELAAQSQIIATITSYQNGYNGQNTYGVGNITAAKYFPTDIKNNGGNLTNSWTGPVSVIAANTVFTLNWGGVPDDSCAKIAILKAPSLQGLAINGNAQALPVTTAAANAACTAGANNIAYTSN